MRFRRSSFSWMRLRLDGLVLDADRPAAVVRRLAERLERPLEEAAAGVEAAAGLDIDEAMMEVGWARQDELQQNPESLAGSYNNMRTATDRRKAQRTELTHAAHAQTPDPDWPIHC